MFTTMSRYSLFLTLAGLLVVGIFLVTTAGGETIRVETDGSGDYTSIQEALQAAIDGDIIEVGEGMYEENVEIDDQVELKGTEGSMVTIQGDGTGDVVKLVAENVSLLGLSITGSGEDHAGVNVTGDGSWVMDLTCFDNNIGILVEANFVLTNGNNCSNNSGVGIKYMNSEYGMCMMNTCSDNKNYGVYSLGSSSLNIFDNAISRNSYGIYVRHSTNVTVESNTCTGNYDFGIYSAVTNQSSFRSNHVTDNQKGIVLSHVEDSVISANSCSGNVQGILLSTSNENVLEENVCTNNSDGFYLETSEHNMISRNICLRNEEDGIELADASSHNTLDFNNLSLNGERGIYIRASSGHNNVENNAINFNKIGIRLAQYSSNNSIMYNNIFLNSDFGIHAANNGDEVDAVNNWWGNDTGPLHAISNPNGSGDNVTDLVVFSPWAKLRVNHPPSVVIDMDHQIEVKEGDSIRFIGHGDDVDRIIRYAWRSNRDGEFYNGTKSEFTYDDLSEGTHKIYFKVQDEHGAWSREVSITIDVAKGEDESNSALIIAVVILVIVAGVGAMFFLKKK